MKKSLLIIMGLALISIDGIAQKGQGRGPDRDHRQREERKEEFHRDRTHYGNNNRHRQRGYSQFRHRPDAYYAGRHRGNTTVIVRRSPGIRYDRYFYSGPGYRVDFGYGPAPARRVLSPREVNWIANDMELARFDDRALLNAKAAIRKRNIRADDVAYLMQQLSFDDNRLELAKFAWNRTIDKRNYHRVFNKLRFRSNQRELDRYINRY